MKKVVVGLSGGVDSSVAAYLLKEQGYDVTGLFMINWHETEGTLSGDCPWNDDLIFAELVARKLEIPFQTIDFSVQYGQRVVDYMFNEYQKGRTPNPDVLCNREVKFDLFAKAAFELGADFVATGHYCRKETITKNGRKVHRLLAGTDPSKEQSYFLCQVNQEQLSKALFPIGHLYKKDIRLIAEEQGLATAKKKDSQGICFVGKVDLPTFLQQKLNAKKGIVVEIPKDSNDNPSYIKPVITYNYFEDELKVFAEPAIYSPKMGVLAGEHDGAHFYTIGQRKGLNIGGRKEPLFVLGIDVVENVVYVGQGHNHPGLNRYGLFIPRDEIHWIRSDLEMKTGEIREYLVRVRYRQALQKACLHCVESGIYILFEDMQRGITSGQFAAWYDDEELVGSGVIK
ncbi:MAG: tRNA 2-thiouridine(34) synthase MnmA [Bacteroidales bacterium]|nr:tRNA 2-thiouridine(34) synthase MnmA [Bacteroidales bacterium]MBN2819275.1 tRNA 2-thiouridine(34) synthase MnmA [Bacteroidales bacterium]